MSTQEKDQTYFQSGVQELSDYLLSKELYWPLSSSLPRLTIGGLLLAQKRLEARAVSVSPAAQADFLDLESQLDAVRTKWRAAWERKAAREVRARYDLWENYLADYRAAPERYGVDYPQEVRWRAMLHLLLAELPTPPAEGTALTSLDAALRAAFVPGEFVWETDLENGFPRDEYWFLYGTLRG